MNNQKTILATTYAVNPYKGSEDGMGWNFILQIARFNKVIAITRKNNRTHVEKYMTEFPNQNYGNIQFYYYDVPKWLSFWKKGSRGAMLYFWMWQRGVVGFIKEQQLNFDIAHNLNFHNDWTPSYLWKLNKPFIWGPIGHHPPIPSECLKKYHFSYTLKEQLTWIVKKYFWNYSYSLRKTREKADFICCMNQSVPLVLPLSEKKYSIIPSVATEDFGYIYEETKQFTIISAGRFVPLKGFDLGLTAFSEFLSKLEENEKLNCKYMIVGSGPELSYFKKIVSENNIEKNVEFIEWIERKELMQLYRTSSVFLFPSHEGAGMVVAEALSFGLPVICLDNEGPGEFITDSCGFGVKMKTYQETISELSNSISTLYRNPELLCAMKKAARIRFEQFFSWDVRGEQLQKIYQSF